MPQKTTLLKTSDAVASRRWHHIDAKDQVLGRLATRAATLLRGKHKPDYTDHIDCGDFVVVTNAEKIRLTGNKLDQKFYFSHSGYAGGAKVTPLRRVMEKDPRKVVTRAIRRMIHGNRLRIRQMARLKVYNGAKHSHPQLRSAA